MKKLLLIIIVILISFGCANPNEAIILWSLGEIPYCYKDSFTSAEQKIIENG